MSDSDTVQMEFSGQVRGKDYRITTLVAENLPRVSIKQNEELVVEDVVKSVDDLKIFPEERPYKYLET